MNEPPEHAEPPVHPERAARPERLVDPERVGASERAAPSEPPRARFRRTLVNVLVVQAVTLALLGLLQIVYTS